VTSKPNSIGEIAYVGACRANVELDRASITWDEPIIGAVVLRGGRENQHVTSVLVRLRQVTAGGERTVMALPPIASFGVRAGDQVRLPFVLEPPRSAAVVLSTPAWVAAQIEPGPEDFRETVTVRVWIEPPEPFARIGDTLAEVSGVRFVQWTGTPNGVFQAECVLAGAMRGAFDGLSLIWTSAADPNRPSLLIDRAQHSAADMVRALGGLDKRSIPLRLDPQDPEGMKAAFKEHLEPYLPRPPRLRDLPIPDAAAASAGEQLPRPASSPGMSAADRPVPAAEPES